MSAASGWRTTRALLRLQGVTVSGAPTGPAQEVPVVNQPKRESKIQEAVVLYARARRVIARKLDFGEGWPDYLFLFNGRVLFIEFKRKGEEPQPLQVYTHSILRGAGF